MGPTQNETISHKDVLDGLITATQKYEERRDMNDKVIFELVQDHKALKYKLQNVPSPFFASYVFELEELFGKAEQCKQNMNVERANAAAIQILTKYSSHEYAIDAKSSESRLNKLNRTPNMVSILASKKSEKAITFKDEAKQSLLDGFRGKSKSEAID